MMKIKIGILVMALMFTSVSPYSFGGNPRTAEQSSHDGNPQSASQSQGMMCHMPGMAQKHDHEMMMAHNMVGAMTQNKNQNPDSDENQDTETHRYSPGDGCSAVNPNAPNKKRDGVNPNTVGCKCVKKCVKGETQEDLSKENGVYICSNACHKDRCTCPDPCKS